MFVFGDFNVHHKAWLTYSGGTDRLGKCCYNFFNSNDLTQIINFPTLILYCNSHFLVFSIYLFFLMLMYVLNWLSFHGEILIMLLSRFPLTFHQTQNEMPRFIPQLTTILVLAGAVFVIICSAVASEFCGWVWVGIDVYIPHQVSGQASVISMVFSCLCCCHS